MTTRVLQGGGGGGGGGGAVGAGEGGGQALAGSRPEWWTEHEQCIK